PVRNGRFSSGPFRRCLSPGPGLVSRALAFAWVRSGLVGAGLRLVRSGLVGAGPPRVWSLSGFERGIPPRKPHSTGQPRPGGGRQPGPGVGGAQPRPGWAGPSRGRVERGQPRPGQAFSWTGRPRLQVRPEPRRGTVASAALPPRRPRPGPPAST